jgi:hypothetical protein
VQALAGEEVQPEANYGLANAAIWADEEQIERVVGRCEQRIRPPPANQPPQSAMTHLKASQ